MLQTEKLLGQIASRTHERQSKIFWSFVRMAACAVSAGQREPEYLAEAGHWDRECLALFGQALGALIDDMEKQPYTDLLGPIYMEWGSKGDQQRGGEFFTPQVLCDLMARMTFSVDQMPATGPLKISEPACGAGAMILSFAKAMADAGISPMRLRATCVDVSRAACDMCYINLTLWGIPAEIIHGNTLSLEQWGGWRNLLWYMPYPNNPMSMLAAIISDIASTEAESEDEEPLSFPPITLPPEIAAEALRSVADSRGQHALDFGGLDFPPLS